MKLQKQTKNRKKKHIAHTGTNTSTEGFKKCLSEQLFLGSNMEIEKSGSIEQNESASSLQTFPFLFLSINTRVGHAFGFLLFFSPSSFGTRVPV